MYKKTKKNVKNRIKKFVQKLNYTIDVDRVEYSLNFSSPDAHLKDPNLLVLHQSNPSFVFWDQKPNFEIITYSSDGSDHNPNFFSGLSNYKSYLAQHYPLQTEGWGDSFDNIKSRILQRHSNILMCPNDVYVSASAINSIFAVANVHKLDFFHPSLSYCSYWSFEHLLNKPGFIVRQAPHIEAIMPGFSNRAFACLQQIPAISKSAYGYANKLWPCIANKNALTTAIIDSVVIRHMRPVRSNVQVFADGSSAYDHSNAVSQYIEDNKLFLANLL